MSLFPSHVKAAAQRDDAEWGWICGVNSSGHVSSERNATLCRLHIGSLPALAVRVVSCLVGSGVRNQGAPGPSVARSPGGGR